MLKKPILSNMQSGKAETSLYYPEKLQKSSRAYRREHLGKRSGYFVFKRIGDIFISLLVVLLIFPWLFPILALLIRLDSKGPVFFRQKRAGYFGKIFWCYKFRTMYVNDTADTRRASRNDPRVTPIGQFLRNTCLDEVPQFINVLFGDMSIVGPRPHMLKDSREFSSVVDNYKFRSLVRPGITGLSQVRGYRGPATNFESIFRRYQWDAYYVRNTSLRLDCKIMGGTGLLMLQSLFHRNKPVPLDSPVFSSQSKNTVKKIA